MADPEDRRVYWDSGTNNFRDFDSGQIVSRLVGFEHLHQTFVSGVDRYRDDLGRLVPNIGDLIPNSLRTQYINRAIQSEVSLTDPFSQRAPEGTFWQSLSVFLKPDGTLGVIISNFAGNQPINPEVDAAKFRRNYLDEAERLGFHTSDIPLAIEAQLAVQYFIAK